MDAEGRESLPLFPLQTVLMPGGLLRLRIFEPRYLKLAGHCISTGAGFGIPAIRSGNEAGVPATPFEVGTLATISGWNQGTDGLLSLVVEGSRRFHLHDWSPDGSGVLQGRVSWFEPMTAMPLGPRHGYLAQLLQSLGELVPIAATSSSGALCEAERLVYRLTERLPLESAQRVEILSQTSLDAQLEIVGRHVERVLQRGTDSLH